MDPQDEQRLREEVIYLHSLWHQGPPTPHPHPPPSIPTHFTQAENSKKWKIQESPPEDSGIKWPCEPISDPSPVDQCGWSVWTKTQPNSEPHLSPSPQQQAWAIATRSQFKALNAVDEFFKSKDSDSDSDDDDDEEEEGGGNEGSESGFFAKLFEEDSGLREFYVKHCENGEFSCLVCSGVGKLKRFKDCIALVQHTRTIAKTKKMKAHRAYGKVICNVLGWDIDNLSSIVSLLSEKRALLLKSVENKEGGAQASSVNAIEDLAANVVDNVDAVKDNNDEELRVVASGAGKIPDNGESEVSESAQSVPVPNGGVEDLSKGVAEGVQDNTEITLDTMEPHKAEDGDKKEDEDNLKTNAVVDDPKESEIQN